MTDKRELAWTSWTRSVTDHPVRGVSRGREPTLQRPPNGYGSWAVHPEPSLAHRHHHHNHFGVKTRHRHGLHGFLQPPPVWTGLHTDFVPPGSNPLPERLEER